MEGVGNRGKSGESGGIKQEGELTLLAKMERQFAEGEDRRGKIIGICQRKWGLKKGR